MRRSGSDENIRLKSLLEWEAEHPHDIPEAFYELAEKTGPIVYKRLLYLLAHLDLEWGRAQKIWMAALEHRKKLTRLVGREVGIRVALLDYLMVEEPFLTNPKFIEIADFDGIVRSAIRDSKTGLYNHPYFESALNLALNTAHRYKFPLSLILLDIDHFKKCNDSYGHSYGDTVLKETAELLVNLARTSDLVARWGGEEFTLLLPYTTVEGAAMAAERIRICVSEHEYPAPKGQTEPLHLTVSMGVAVYPSQAESALELFDSADAALYQAKGAGRNQVRVYQPEMARNRSAGA